MYSDIESDMAETSRKGPKSRPPLSRWRSKEDFDEITKEGHLAGAEEKEAEEKEDKLEE
jgi:hypothetical protein